MLHKYVVPQEPCDKCQNQDENYSKQELCEAVHFIVYLEKY